MPVTLMNMGDEPGRSTQDKCTRDGLYAHLSELVARHLDSSRPVEELLATTDLQDGEKAAKYELRHKTIAVSESGLVGRCTTLEMQSTVDAQFEYDCLKALSAEQPDMSWAVVAGRVNRINLRKTHFSETTRRGFSDDAVDGAIAVGLMQQRKGNLVPSNRVHTQIPEYKAILEVAFAGVGGSLIDPWVQRTQQIDGSPLQAYMRTKALRHMPNNMRKQRTLATALITEFYAQQTMTPVVAEEAEASVRITAEQIAAGLLLRQQGMQWVDIGKVFGVSHQLARASIEKAQKAASVQEA